ncbi:MAG: VaFE repeat-containing surface-anchored protein, partial [Eubacterium sp.]|nr:VaFE repeat-containing surface-anchored protein [Eubacterium sp.]
IDGTDYEYAYYGTVWDTDSGTQSICVIIGFWKEAPKPWRRFIKVKKEDYLKRTAVTGCDLDVYTADGTKKVGDMVDNGDGTYSWWSDWMTTDAYQQIAIKEVKGGGIYNNAYNNNKWLHSDGTLSNTVEAISTSYEYKGEELASYPIKFSGKQTFKTFLYLQKSSANTSYTDGNPNYSLAGAEYKVFKSSAEAQASISSRDFSKAFATITTDASGKTSTIDVTSQMDTYSDGTIKETAFYVIESKAPKNYKMDNGVHPVTVTTANTDDNPAKVSVSDVPVNDPIRATVKKLHKDGTEDEDGLEGAVFTLKFYPQDIDRNYTFAQLQQFTPTITKTYTTAKDTDNKIRAIIKDEFPIGYITLEENKAPEGFVIKDTDKATVNGVEVSPKMAFVLPSTGNALSGYSSTGAYYIDNRGNRSMQLVTNTTVYNEFTKKNEQGRGDIRLIKHRHKSDVPLAGAEFEIKNTETNESVTLTTDENGIIDTSAKYKSHSEGVWFKLGAQGTSEKTPDDTKGALPFGIYTVTEINAPEGYQKEETITVNIKNDGEIITVYDNARTDNLEVISDMETAKIGTQALVETPHGETKVLPAAPGQTIHDICEYSGLKYGQEYTLIGRLMEKADDGSVKPFMTKDDEGNEVEATGITYFRTGSTYTYSRYDSEGTETVEFANLDFTGKEGTSFVVYERLYLGHVTEEDIESGNYDKNYADSNNTTEFPIIHENPDDLNQTVKTPKGETDANTEDETKTVSSASKHFIINDTAKYEGLEVGRTYRLDGQLYIRPNNDSDDKEYTDAELEKLRVKDKDGSFVTATTTFVPETESGTTVVTFEYDLEYEIEKRTYVVFEDCYDIEDGNVKMFAHADIHDDRQSFYQPVISTQAKGTEGRSELCYTEGKFIDTIKYENLEANTRFTVEGVAMDKATGKELLLNGKTVKATATFTTGASTNPNGAVDGEYDLEFKISEDQQNDLKGKTIVIYETLKNQSGTIIAEHKDINDKDQELTVPDLKTTLLGEKTKEHIVFPDEITTLIDTCTYTNLIPEKEYAIYGTLMNMEKNKPLLDENGNKITGSTKFTADKSGSGVVEVKFTFNAKILKIEGESIVAFEKVLPTDGSIPVGTHMDINDEDQTVRIPKVGTKVSKSSWTSKETISLTDSISYSNLATDKKFKAKGWLVDKDGNKVIVDGNQIYKEVEFTPSSENGMIDVKFEDFSAESLSGKYVVFEEVYLVKEDGSESEVGEHKDLTDSNQTITVTKIPKVPKTGDTVPIIPIITIMLAAFAGIAAIVTIKKNKKNDK